MGDILGFSSCPHPPGVVQPDKYKPVPDEPPNPTNIEERLKSVRSNDKEMEEVNLNNIQVSDPHPLRNNTVPVILTADVGGSPSPSSPIPP